jgi:hypothetical protein
VMNPFLTMRARPTYAFGSGSQVMGPDSHPGHLCRAHGAAARPWRSRCPLHERADRTPRIGQRIS